MNKIQKLFKSFNNYKEELKDAKLSLKSLKDAECYECELKSDKFYKSILFLTVNNIEYTFYININNNLLFYGFSQK